MNSKWLADFLFNRLAKTQFKRAPNFTIGPKHDPYLRRWFIVPRNRFLNVYLHKIMRDDDDRALHDHPWASLSIVLRGVIGEYYADNPTDKNGKPEMIVRERWFESGDIVYRGSRSAHRLIVAREKRESSPGYYPAQPVWTLFITGPTIRKWGFWCPDSWRYWRDFVKSDDTGNIGRGCE